MAKEDVTYRFDDFLLDTSNRQLWRDGAPVDLNARYFDALVLLVREHGQLVEKDRFFAEVWDDVVVSDSALTQCIKDVRKQLGDDASNPRYIQTVPRHGYRFIGAVEAVPPEAVPPEAVPPEAVPPEAVPPEAVPPEAVPPEAVPPEAVPPEAVPPEAVPPEAVPPEAVPPEAVHLGGSVGASPLPEGGIVPRAGADEGAEGRSTRHAEPLSLQAAALWGSTGALGGGFAGVLGGLLYGSALAYTPSDPELGSASILLVLLSLNVLVGFVGGFGVSFGMAAVGWLTHRALRWSIAGAALGGLLMGGGMKLIGVDAFNLLFGRAPAGITGGLEGAALGAALALGARLGGGPGAAPPWRPVVGAGVAGAVAGALIPIAGGHLMGGSLVLLARSFDGSRLQVDALGRFFGEVHFGYTTQVALGSIEGLLFGSCVAGALVLARRARARPPLPVG